MFFFGEKTHWAGSKETSADHGIAIQLSEVSCDFFEEFIYHLVI